MLVLRALLHSSDLFAIPGGIDEARAIVNDLDDPLIETPYAPHLGEVYIERIEPGDGAEEVAVPSGYERHGEWLRGRDDDGSIRTIPSTWSDRKYHLGVSFAEACLAERRLARRRLATTTRYASPPSSGSRGLGCMVSVGQSYTFK